jgi:hypothetical protein
MLELHDFNLGTACGRREVRNLYMCQYSQTLQEKEKYFFNPGE